MEAAATIGTPRFKLGMFGWYCILLWGKSACMELVVIHGSELARGRYHPSVIIESYIHIYIHIGTILTYSPRYNHTYIHTYTVGTILTYSLRYNHTYILTYIHQYWISGVWIYERGSYMEVHNWSYFTRLFC